MLYARILECLCDPNWLIQNGKCSTKISSFLATAHIHTFPQNAKQKQPKILTVIVHWNTQISFKYGFSYVTYVKWTLETQFSQDLSIGSLYWLETWLNSHQVLMKKKNKQTMLIIHTRFKFQEHHHFSGKTQQQLYTGHYRVFHYYFEQLSIQMK